MYITEYEFIKNHLFPLLSFEAKQAIYKYTSSRLDIEPCIKVLSEREVKLTEELNNLGKAIARLRMLK